MSAEAEKKKNTEAIRRLQKANLDLTNQVKALTRALKSRAADGSQRNVFTGQGIGRGIRQTMIRGGYGTTVRNYEMGGMAGLVAGSIAGGLGAAVVGGAQVARAYGRMKAIDSNIYMTSGQKSISQIESVTGMLGGIGSGFLQDEFNKRGITKRRDIEQGAVSGIAARLNAARMQGFTYNEDEAQIMAARETQISKDRVEANIRAARLGGDKGLARDAKAASEAAMDSLKQAIVQAILEGFSALKGAAGQALEDSGIAGALDVNSGAHAPYYSKKARQFAGNMYDFSAPGNAHKAYEYAIDATSQFKNWVDSHLSPSHTGW